MPNIATAYVQIVPTAKGISGDLKSILDEPATKAGESAGAKVSGGISKSLKVGAAAMGAAVIGATGAVVSGAKNVAAYGDNIDKMSQKLGLSAEAYQKWDYVLNLAGADMQSMQTGLKTLTNKLDDAKNGNAGAIESFEKLGISMADLSTMSREDLFGAAIAGFQQMEDSTERAALANDLFGKSGQNLAPLFNTTSEATAELIKQAEDYGMIMSDDLVGASAAFQDSMTTLSGTLTGLKNNILGEFLPSMTQVTDGLAMIFAGDIEAGLANVQEGINGFVGSFTAMIPEILQVGGTILMTIAQGIIDALPQLTAAAPVIIQTLITFLTSNLPAIVSFAAEIIVALVIGITQALPQLVGSIPQIITAIVQTLSANAPQLASAGVDLVRGLWQGISNSLEWIKSLISGWVGNVIQFIKNLFGISSPSKVMADQIGQWIPAGIAVGIEANTDVLDDAMKDLSYDATAAFDMSNMTVSPTSQTPGNISVVIYASPGQSVEELYTVFERRLTNSILRKEAVYA